MNYDSLEKQNNELYLRSGPHIFSHARPYYSQSQVDKNSHQDERFPMGSLEEGFLKNLVETTLDNGQRIEPFSPESTGMPSSSRTLFESMVDSTKITKEINAEDVRRNGHLSVQDVRPSVLRPSDDREGHNSGSSKTGTAIVKRNVLLHPRPHTPNSNEDVPVLGLENGQPFRRHYSAPERKHNYHKKRERTQVEEPPCNGSQGGDYNSLHTRQDFDQKTIQELCIHCDSSQQGLCMGNQVYQQFPAPPNDFSVLERRTSSSTPQNLRQDAIRPLDETRGDDNSGTLRRAKINIEEDLCYTGQTLTRRGFYSRNLKQVCGRSCNPSPLQIFLPCNLLPLDESFSEDQVRRLWLLQPQVFRNKGKQPHLTKVASTDEEFLLPLNVKPVRLLNLDTILPQFNKEKLDRFLHLLDLLGEARPTKKFSASRRSKCLLTLQDINLLLEHDIIGKVDTGKQVSRFPHIIPFSVIEEKERGQRRRFIAWPKESNEAVRNKGYIPQVPLQHISAYLPAVLEEYAFITDLTTSFFQVAIPEPFRDRFQFEGPDGLLCELHRLPMGHVVSPEIMQSITSVLAGHPDYTKSSFTRNIAIPIQQEVIVHVWIDNVRFVGPKQQVMAQKESFLQRCVEAHATLNTEDTYSGRRYNFIGVYFNHEDNSVQVREKTLSRLQPYHGNLTFGEAERLYSQLQFCSGILGISPSRFYHPISIFRHRASVLSKAAYLINQPVHFPKQCQKELQLWIEEIKSNQPRVINKPRNTHTFTLFTDSSLEGWGGVLINEETFTIWSYGSKWTNMANAHINELEALAVPYALHTVSSKIPKHSTIHLKIDNTVVLGSLRRGRSNTESINKCINLIENWFAKHECDFDFQYIASVDNLADRPSRNKHLIIDGSEVSFKRWENVNEGRKYFKTLMEKIATTINGKVVNH